MRKLLFVALTVLICGCRTASDQALTSMDSANRFPAAQLQVEIQSPPAGSILVDHESWIDVEGGASVFGGVRSFDLMLVLDTSQSLRGSDPKDYRSAGAIGLVESLSPRSNIQLGVVDFDARSKLVLPLTTDRTAAIKALRGLNQYGKTNLAGGIRAALEELERNARPGSSRAMLLFTDGKSNASKARQAMAEATERGVAIHALLLGTSKKGASILRELAQGTGGSFMHVADPAQLLQAFLELRTTGVEQVTLSVNGSAAHPTQMTGGTFSGRVPLEPGPNEIVATATSIDGQTRQHTVRLNVRSPGCAELEITAVKNGVPALSISERAVEVVFDASNSMWGQLQGQAKISIAQDILQDALEGLPNDLNLALRAYGHRDRRELRNCADSELLVPFASRNREQISQEISKLKPRGQTPLAYALKQIATDFAGFHGERAVVLVTDGIESCGGDPVAVARSLREQDIRVHVIGFGLGSEEDEDLTSLQAIAEASGGRFLSARTAKELREALAVTVGTAYRVMSGDDVVAQGAVGADEPLRLPSGDYRVQLASKPPHELSIRLFSEEALTLVLEKEGSGLSPAEQRGPAEYSLCEESESDPASSASEQEVQ